MVGRGMGYEVSLWKRETDEGVRVWGCAGFKPWLGLEHALSRPCPHTQAAEAHIDENTIGVIGILGSTYTGGRCAALKGHQQGSWLGSLGLNLPSWPAPTHPSSQATWTTSQPWTHSCVSVWPCHARIPTLKRGLPSSSMNATTCITTALFFLHSQAEGEGPSQVRAPGHPWWGERFRAPSVLPVPAVMAACIAPSSPPCLAICGSQHRCLLDSSAVDAASGGMVAPFVYPGVCVAGAGLVDHRLQHLDPQGLFAWPEICVHTSMTCHTPFPTALACFPQQSPIPTIPNNLPANFR